MDTHQSRKSEVDAKTDKFNLVEETAKELMDRNHYASIEIKERLDNLLEQRQVLDEEWDLHWEDLQICKSHPLAWNGYMSTLQYLQQYLFIGFYLFVFVLEYNLTLYSA